MDILEVLGLDALLAWFILAVGGSMVAGNGFALMQARRGHAPKGAQGELRRGRAWWLLGVGAVISLWGVASLAAG
jgi:hypothetical protein